VLGFDGDPVTSTQAMLVRPDGHLGWRGDNRDRLERWLDETLTLGRPGR
jgi:hypothetical protein